MSRPNRLVGLAVLCLLASMIFGRGPLRVVLSTATIFIAIGALVVETRNKRP